MAHVDLKTGRIYGCEKGSLVYYHEVGHLEFDKTLKGSTIRLYQGYLFNLWAMILTVGVISTSKILKFLALLLLTIHFGIDYYEEKWCDAYAELKFNEKGRKKK